MPVDKEATANSKRAKRPQEEPPEVATPDSLPSSRRRGRPDTTAVSTTGAADPRQKRLELLVSKPSHKPLAPTATAPPTARIPMARHNGVQDPSKRPRYGSGRIAAVATSASAQSPQRSTPVNNESLSPEQSGRPPKIRVLATSTTGSPKAQPYDGFSGVPTYVGAPGVIVVTPRLSPTGAGTPSPSRDAGPDRGRQETAAESSTPVDDPRVDEAALINAGRRPTLLQAWALCVVAAATLNLPSLSQESRQAALDRYA
ncbi:hypothetical protein MRX96_020640 [Rhipicephalus microplus]